MPRVPGRPGLREGFQSHCGAIKREGGGFLERSVLRFNPTVVRLKHVQQFRKPQRPKFQSHCGAIKSVLEAEDLIGLKMFQSHCGAIKSASFLQAFDRFKGFQSHCGAIKIACLGRFA